MNVRVLTGRTRRLLPVVAEEIGAALSGDARLILIVPEQYTLQAEIEIIQRLQLPGFMTLEVLSPSRLSERVFALAGAPAPTRIGPDGKCMALSETLRQNLNQLVYYRSAAQRRGFVKTMSEMLGDLKRAGLTADSMEALVEGTEGTLREKLKDMACLLEGYQARLQGRFVDGEDVQEALRQRLAESGFLNNAHVWVYGFDLIVPQSAALYCVIAKLAQSLTIALTWDRSNAPDGAVFEPARKTLAQLARRFDLEGILWKHEHRDEPLQASEFLRHLESGLFAPSPSPYSGDTAGLTFSVAPNPYGEAEQAAAYVLDCLREGYSMEEIRIVHGDFEGGGDALVHTFRRFGIPVYLDRKRPALGHPLFRALMSAFRTATRGWQADSMLDWLKSGLSNLRFEEAAQLEVYARAYGIRGARWTRPFERGEPELLETLEPLRQRAVQPLRALQEGLRDAADATASLNALWNFIEAVELPAKVEWMRDELLSKGLRTEALDFIQAWQFWLSLLDQLHALQNGRRIPMRALVPTLEAGLEALELASVPPEQGSVVVSRLGHVKHGALRVLILLGLHDGVLAQGDNALLSEEELAQAERVCGTSLGLYANELVQLARMNLLDTLAAPTERLWVSHAFTGCSGEVRRPASVFLALERMFPDASKVGGIEPGTLHGIPAVLFAPGPLLDALGPLLREATSGHPVSAAWRESIAALLADGEWGVRCRRLMRLLRPNEALPPLNPRTTKALYARASQSVTRLETFASCPYQHFVRYGLRPRENKDYSVERDEAGTFYHQVMEAYVREAMVQADRWPAHWTREDSDALCDRIMQPLLQAWDAGPLGENALQRLAGRRYARVARRAAWTFSRQMQACAFWPAEMELRFGMGGPLPPFFLELPDGQRLALEGRIDRVDLWEDDARLYLRILDYKSGQTEIQPTKVYYGLQLQLLIYLAVSLRAYPQASPAGAFYFHVDEPIVNEPSRLKETVEERLMKALRLRGIVLSDLKVVKAMDTGEQPLSLPEIFKRDGAPRANASAVSETEMDALLRHAQRMGALLATQINAGHLDRKPAEIQSWNACQWCTYRTICLHDPRHSGRRLEKMDHRDLVARIVQEQSAGEQAEESES